MMAYHMSVEMTPQRINPHATHCIYTLRHDGIHVFAFVDQSREAMDEWLIHLDTMFASLKPDEKVRYIMDYRAGKVPSLVYGANRARDWLIRNPEHNPARVAFIHNSSMLMSMLENIVKLLRARRVTARFFTDEARAVAWLLEA